MSAQLDTLVEHDVLRRELESRGVTWPIGGYAPGLYVGHCAFCDEPFMGAKRSIRCLPCAIDDVRSHHATWCRMSEELTEIVEMDELRSGISDPGHFAYPTFCTAARVRLAAMQRDIDALEPVVEMMEGLEA